MSDSFQSIASGVFHGRVGRFVGKCGAWALFAFFVAVTAIGATMYFTLMLPYFVCSLVVVMFDGGVDEVFSEMGWKRDS